MCILCCAFFNNKCFISFHSDVDRSTFAYRSFYITNIVEVKRLMWAKELRFYIETPAKILKEFKCSSDIGRYIKNNMEE